MFKKILVPIDGSTFSEAVLPHIRALAMTYNADVHLMRVETPYEPPWGVVLTSLPEPMQLEPAEQLEILADQLKVEGIKATTEVIRGHAAESILECARHRNVDLIAMTTHGRSGISRWLMGSVASKVVHAATVPVLLIRPK